MKPIILAWLAIVALISPLCFSAETSNPVTYLAHRPDIPQDAQTRMNAVGFKKIAHDVNGDAVVDILLCYDDPETDDASEVQARIDAKGALPWDVFVNNQANNAYIISKGVDFDVDGDISLGAAMMVNPNLVFIGQVTEISRFGIVTAEQDSPREGPETTTIWAYTWENDHMKRQKLAEYESSEENAIFDKYLADGKRTVVQVQQVTP